MRFRSALALSLMLACSTAALAGTITVTESTLATGSVGGTQFVSAPKLVTFTVTGDTSSVVNTGGVFYQLFPAGSATATVEGVGTFNIVDTFYAFSNISGPTGYAGIYDFTTGFTVSTHDASLDNYTLNGAFGPLTSASEKGNPALNLAAGVNLNLFSYTDGTFRVTAAGTPAATPEPGSFALVCTGTCAMAGMVRRRFQRA